jgi:hypothetical protein
MQPLLKDQPIERRQAVPHMINNPSLRHIEAPNMEYDSISKRIFLGLDSDLCNQVHHLAIVICNTVIVYHIAQVCRLVEVLLTDEGQRGRDKGMPSG